ncbi:hypothetical protein [Aeromicrobium sp. 9AM]|uniref:hypothetical protein n=1 Tax=Aeromicrobium sp. 9AM TaxID=2653126 RepID=UPI0012F3E00F|nr:hypothetical protein [Aeromicrobium sp. 9AM]VXC07655.1 conserved hypothetical protein [Aeromicrobium sp. 9AM]
MSSYEIETGPDNELRSEIKHALNRASAENPSGSPDHILADFLLDSLAAFDRAVQARATWRGESVELPALTRLHEAPPLVDPDATS